MEFRTAYSKHKRFFQSPTSKFKRTFAMELDENGHKILKETGKENIYAMIQSHAEECEIENIVNRVRMGDKDALARVEAKYLDTTELPKDLAEAQNKIIQVKNEFYTLPLEIREKFDHSPEVYVQQYGGEEWAKMMGFVKETENKAKEIEKESEVTNE